jgi:predicted amidohydrolase YtcJ
MASDATALVNLVVKRVRKKGRTDIHKVRDDCIAAAITASEPARHTQACAYVKRKSAHHQQASPEQLEDVLRHLLATESS